MNSTDNAALNNKSNKSVIILLVMIAAVAALISSNSSVRAFFLPKEDQRKVLSKTNTTYDGIDYTVLKILTAHGIEIEIYEKDPLNFERKLKQKFQLNGDKEAFLSTADNPVNLAVSDIDKNGIPDIIVPTVDRAGQSRLNVFKFEPDFKQFVPSVQTEDPN